MTISRVTAIWTGFTGAPGYTNFFFRAFGGGDAVDLEVARVRAFFAPLQVRLPNTVRIAVQQEAAILDEATGDLIDYAQATTAPTAVAGSSTDSYSAPAGAAVTWNTNGIARGRRLRGRTFLVPLAGGAYQNDGTLASATITDINTGAAALIGNGTGPEAVIWSRPRDGQGGTIAAISSHRVADQVAILRSRRD